MARTSHTISKSTKVWAGRYNVPVTDAERLRNLLALRARYGIHEANGDPIPGSANSDDKNKNARYWGEQERDIQIKIENLLERYHMTMDFGTGLYGSLKQNGKYIDNIV